MAVRRRNSYRSSLEAVYGALTDRKHLEDKYRALGARSVVVTECGPSGDVFRIRCRREVPADVPGFAAKFLGEWNVLEETTEWRDEGAGKRARFEARVASLAPITIRGDFSLVPSGAGCVQELSLEASISVPLLGGRIAGFVESQTGATIEKDYELTKKFLGE